ncbi:Outer membrane receptor proteins, mostly Fe transport [Filimonas lacunae]|uniref:Outer membrane receptor proteins, mostly Fe transport n=1 Tax=Filimonas lacunae TaxID=477680 RepID=A0A173MLT5_9BACT|nr:TonB-dependent receptor [Filimonas lacunae]BAV08361.1 TonB-dependent receptor [Filimonas lacunae]SIT33457.1 Outer membrane receptor proteins, mostly Fe transport [Filimonas lacunae]
MKKILAFVCTIFLFAYGHAQKAGMFTGKVYDALSKEPVAGAVITGVDTQTVITDVNGSFTIYTNGTTLTVSCMGFEKRTINAGNTSLAVALKPSDKQLQQVVVSANRTAEKRNEVPVAIAVISKQTIEDTKAQRLDQLLNKVSGVFMVNLGNEQHEMSIRQPMTTKSVFLYMEDGIPIRTTGVYNHNALLEMNMAAAKSIEVIKGPSSALYGAEAIAGAVNIITQSAPAYTAGTVSAQMNNKGYKRTDAQIGTSIGKWGIMASGYYANRTDGPIEFSNFHKSIVSLRTDYRASDKLTWANTFTYMDYNSDMTGTLDSIKFAQKNLSSQQSFTYRKVYALRYKSMLNYQWKQGSASNVSFLFRDNSVKQNPSYSIGTTTDATRFRGQINENAFRTFALFLQHTQQFHWLHSKLIAGASVDVSPQRYKAQFISIHKDVASGKYDSYSTNTPDSLLSNYTTGITNYAAYVDYEVSPMRNVKLVGAVRYDAFRYNYTNKLPVSTTSGAASTINNYSRIAPKLGVTYNTRYIGFYGNYSQGYVPPQLTELYSGTVNAPYLQPQTFYNYEVGGWISLLGNKLYADWSVYLMNGSNEIISVKQPDNTYVNQNTGKTRHKGIEYGITYRPVADVAVRLSATNAKHTFVENVVKGVDYSGKEMSAAPRFTGNAEITYKPHFIRGLRISAEWQHQGKYFMDDLNKTTYTGFDVINVRAGYLIGRMEFWVNALNVANKYYSTFASKNAASSGTAAYSYNLGDPREITVGIACRFGKK